MQKIVPFHIDEYGDEPEAVAIVPGRFHLLGEHTWFAQGNTLSMAINHYLYLCVSKRTDSNFRLFSLSLKERKKISASNLRYRKEDRWANSVKAVILSFIDSGYPVTGLNFTILSEIPADAGLGTPNALKVATALALRKLFASKLSKEALLDILEHANVQHLKTYPHRADILCALFAKRGHCVRTDHRKKTADLYPFPLEGKTIILTDSRVPRLLAREELGNRLQQCIEAYELVKKNPDIPKNMTKLTETMLDEVEIPESVRRRVIYIIRESLSVDDAVDALQKGDDLVFSRIVNRSHEGLRDRFEISCPELDWLVKRALEFVEQESSDMICSRLTGRGFGGCTYSILKTEDVETYIEKLNDYERIFGFKPLYYRVKPSGGARII
ncbi:galactokinase [Treponema phagedenis]|uniref:galactokinase n=1 Tax=Treponema phagedenis TaxID=162 RepID=UPI0001F6376A|nr:galactokinase [Treponema phagedenis]EFW36937.1 putative galactokinase [Treponema phagedenis F0421]TYT76721.1 galactokinase [Treponema phagedenis]TYT77646.1 galactokinase [Treponema phagedenis]